MLMTLAKRCDIRPGCMVLPWTLWLQRQLSALGDSYNDQDILQTSLQSQAATAVTIQCYRGVHGLLQSFQALRLSSLGARNRIAAFLACMQNAGTGGVFALLGL